MTRPASAILLALPDVNHSYLFPFVYGSFAPVSGYFRLRTRLLNCTFHFIPARTRWFWLLPLLFTAYSYYLLLVPGCLLLFLSSAAVFTALSDYFLLVTGYFLLLPTCYGHTQ